MTQQLRRTFLKQGLIATGAFIPLGKVIWPQQNSFDADRVNDTMNALTIQPFLQLAIDTALAAGASYVDCRWTHTKERQFTSFTPRGAFVRDLEDITVGVRSLVGGYWGGSSSPVTSREELARLARESVALAKAGNATGTREVVLADRAVVTQGSWTMPVRIDPFAVHPSEIADRLGGIVVFATNLASTGVRMEANFRTQTKNFLASDGCSFSQTTYLTTGELELIYQTEQGQSAGVVESVTPAGVGLELFDETRLREEIRQVRETLIEDVTLPIKPVDVGRYTTLIRASGVAPIVSTTIGAATEVDRVLGHEANATGTSYLKEPREDVGTFPVGNSLLTVTGDRTMAGGAATVQWDDEGVAPEAFPLVRQGVITDVQTNREGAGWMRDVYARSQSPVRSRGCAFAPNAVAPAVVHTANLRMQPATASVSEADLLKSVNNGILFAEFTPILDFQQLSGYGLSRRCYDVKAGKKVARLINAGALFRTPEFWKSVQAIGDATTAQTVGVSEGKGQPKQLSYHSVTAVPVVVKDMSVIDVLRKA